MKTGTSFDAFLTAARDNALRMPLNANSAAHEALANYLKS